MDQSIEHFHEHGWMRVRGGISQATAAAMREAVWHLLAESGVKRNRLETWTAERPSHMQRLKRHAAFAWSPSDGLSEVIARLLGRSYDPPEHWGAPFIAFPRDERWSIPAKGWHIDANYRSPLEPPRGVKTLALFGDVAPRAGATLVVAGSHRLVAKWFAEAPPPPEARSAELRRSLLAHPYIGDLHRPGDASARIARFLRREEHEDGLTLYVAELIGRAGDVFVMHPLVMHAAAPNSGAEPRFMVSGGVTTDLWGWQAE
ncbi:MAG TPA: phytanoyl-CoA dioxygenase family protein [Croceibacterium sp.]|nr:phytanoyl-CoA dioxygenase family protein [Croceibacterium sp.]